jgi:hypothetical protein
MDENLSPVTHHSEDFPEETPKDRAEIARLHADYLAQEQETSK